MTPGCKVAVVAASLWTLQIVGYAGALAGGVAIVKWVWNY